MASHASIFNREAHYDADRCVLEVTGSTEIVAGTNPPLTIQVGVVQRNAAGTEILATGCGAHAKAGEKPVPGVLASRFTHPDIIDGEPDPSWEVRINGAFEVGHATAFGTQIEFDEVNAAFETFSWTQLIEIEAEKLEDEAPT